MRFRYIGKDRNRRINGKPCFNGRVYDIPDQDAYYFEELPDFEPAEATREEPEISIAGEDEE